MMKAKLQPGRQLNATELKAVKGAWGRYLDCMDATGTCTEDGQCILSQPCFSFEPVFFSCFNGVCFATTNP